MRVTLHGACPVASAWFTKHSFSCFSDSSNEPSPQALIPDCPSVFVNFLDMALHKSMSISYLHIQYTIIFRICQVFFFKLFCQFIPATSGRGFLGSSL